MKFPFTNKNGVTFTGTREYTTRLGNSRIGYVAICPRCQEEFVTTQSGYKDRISCAVCHNRKLASDRKSEVPKYIRSIRNGIMQRCYNTNKTNYSRYGGRGIGVCDRWSDAKDGALNMWKDLGDRPGTGREWSIDRINNDGDYEPSNCRWATRSEQTQNQNAKKGKSVKITKTGKYMVDVYHQGIKLYLGTYSTEYDSNEAVKHFYKAIEKLNGITIKSIK